MRISKFNAEKVVAFCCRKQHILPGSQAGSIQEVAFNLVGIHAARLITPYFALRARLQDLNYLDIHEALYTDKILIKARCMRGTLHLLPHSIYPNAHRATLAKRLGVCRALYKKIGLEKDEVSEMAKTILEVLEDHPLPVASIVKSALDVSRGRRNDSTKPWSPVGIRAVVKELWESGLLCYINTNTKFASEKRFYGLTATLYPMIELTTIDDEKMAVKNLVECHIRGYGPVTVGDITWWSGIDKTRIVEALKTLADRVSSIEIIGFSEKFWITNSDLDLLRQFRTPKADWVAVLAHEDPSLKGYYSSRQRYVSSEHYDLLFNAIGESRPAIMLNGRVVGTWNLNKENGQVTQTMFEPIGVKQQNLVNREMDKVRFKLPHLRQFLNPNLSL